MSKKIFNNSYSTMFWLVWLILGFFSKMAFSSTPSSLRVYWTVEPLSISKTAYEVIFSVISKNQTWNQEEQDTSLEVYKDLNLYLFDNCHIELQGINPSDYSISRMISGRRFIFELVYSKPLPISTLKLTLPSSNDSTPTVSFTPPERSLLQPTLYLQPSQGRTAVYFSTIMAVLSALAGTVVLANSLFNVNGLLLLKFIQFLDYVNIFAFLNVNFRAAIESTLESLLKVTRSTFMSVKIDIRFNNIESKFSKNRGKLTELGVSPVLLENCLPETIFLLILMILNTVFLFLRSGKWTSKLSNLFKSMTFNYVQVILGDQLFYALYQIMSDHNTRSNSWANIASYLCSILSVSLITYCLVKIWTTASPSEYFRMVKKAEAKDSLSRARTSSFAVKIRKPKKEPQEPEVGRLDRLLKYSPKNREQLLKELDHPLYIKSFIDSEIKKEAMDHWLARHFNFLNNLRFLVVALAILLGQDDSTTQIILVACYNLLLLGLSLYAGLWLKIFDGCISTWQKIIQEAMITLVFVVFTVLNFDTRSPFLSPDAVGYISVGFLVIILISLIMELAVFLLNFIASIIKLIKSVINFLTKSGKASHNKKIQPIFREKKPVLIKPKKQLLADLSPSKKNPRKESIDSEKKSCVTPVPRNRREVAFKKIDRTKNNQKRLTDPAIANKMKMSPKQADSSPRKERGGFRIENAEWLKENFQHI